MIIWILGSMASGKTTLNKRLFKSLQFTNTIMSSSLMQGNVDEDNYIYTKSKSDGSIVSSIGILKEGTATCGIDPVMGKLKTTGVELSIKLAFKQSDFVIVEGAQAAITWYDFIQKIDPNFLLVHLNISYDENIKRLKLRQFKKLYSREPVNNEHLLLSISDKNYDSVLGKNKQYNNIWTKISDKVKNKIQVDATLSESEVEHLVLQKIEEML